MTDVEDSVTITDLRHPSRQEDLLQVSTGGNDNERLRIGWGAPLTLRVDVPYVTYLVVQSLAFGPVRLDLHSEPNDPASIKARTAWERAHGLPVF